jgi:hypothetical protein
LSTFEVENIKSAALLIEAGDLRSNLPLYEQVAAFIESESGAAGKKMDDRERILLRTTASLLKEVEPILADYFYHYVEKASVFDKDLSAVPLGSSIIALADLCDRLDTDMLAPPWKDNVGSLEDLRAFSGRAFPPEAVQALNKVISPSA